MTRSEIYLALLPIVNARRCRLPDAGVWRRLVYQLENLERRVGRTGKDSVDHPVGGHDDVANAVAGVLVLGGAGAVSWGNADFGVAREADWKVA